MRPPETRERPAGSRPGDSLDTDRVRSDDHQFAISSWDNGGHRLVIRCPDGSLSDAIDPCDVAGVLAEIHGGPRRAARWLRQVLAEVGS